MGRTNPNPLVGAVIVKNEKIIAEGYHEKHGCSHAEVNAFNNAKVDVRGGRCMSIWSHVPTMEGHPRVQRQS